ncbi:unnamed protein product (macronuclear) [Paramecium tetraurelia]|uniref:Uncharacterized protein n=1 Tax=Paramecium tetraurelia TaxID=5888 RepID=A0CTF1_PARTE|nr:uncharacterized protein GSPATT00010302001 [Paramecium tetraurelia]CAK74068.1 unnamed protein product [Paramecium tetraurelia]|eukprot:XP_001441465.1 hypothetical protein (macronuclear) [Paramecium tetraurelia strain d4-2]
MSQEIQQFRATLPINEFKSEILKQVLENTFIIITGDTGSGKSTQLPQYLLDDEEFRLNICERRKKFLEEQVEEKEQTKVQGFLSKKQKPFIPEDRKNSTDLKIVVTQPRRMAAISMAKRVAFERNQNLGIEVGYSIRFDNSTTNTTQLRYVTDGILVRECLQDKDLRGYDVVILDEAHERSLYTDVLFALVKTAARRRKGSLKVIITSATLNINIFKSYFEGCPYVKVHGKSFPVEVKYSEHNITQQKRNHDAVNAAIRMHLHEGPGDILVFLPGSEDCEVCRKFCYERLAEVLNSGVEVPSVLLYTLYGSQTSEDQSQVFQRADEHTRKIIFCTNIAETSLTIDNIGFVVDTGYVKQKVYNPRTGMDSLIIQPISKTQAIQRTGRAGRTQAGKCYRLFSKQFYESLSEHTTAEIMRVNLASVMLLLKSMGIDDVVRFEFMEQPTQEAILQSLRQLYLIQAIDEDGYITPMGYEMSRYPLEPSYAKALITSKMMECSSEMSAIVAILSTESIWQRITRVDVDGYQKLQEIQSQHADPAGDHLSLLKVFSEWKQAVFNEQFAKDTLLNLRSLKQSDNIRQQLQQLVEGTSRKKCLQFYEQDYLYKLFRKQKDSKKWNINESIKLSLCSGFYFNTARKMHNGEDTYLMVYPEGTVVDTDPQSVYTVIQQYPETVIFTELGGTSQVRGVMKLISEINIEWVKPYFSNMVKVDLFKLARIEFQQRGRDAVHERRQKKIQEQEKQKELEEKQKLEKHQIYKARFEQRKKVKM